MSEKKGNLPHELLKMYRLRIRLTQAELAQFIGLASDRMLRKWEAGYSLPTANRLKNLIEIYLFNDTLTPGKEKQEAAQLWLTIKDWSELSATRARETIYPPFDENWFESLLETFRDIPPKKFGSPVLSKSAKEAQPPNQNPATSDSTKYIPLNNLPPLLSELIGRHQELTQLNDWLGKSSRLIAITGPEGVGKTHLALQLAHQLIQTSLDGVWFWEASDLAGKTVISELVRQLQIEAKQNSVSALKAYLQNKRTLLVLDDFESTWTNKELLLNLLSLSEGMQVIIISRHRSALAGVNELKLRSLGLPTHEQINQLETLDNKTALGVEDYQQVIAEVKASPALQFLIQTARRHNPAFSPDPIALATLARLCLELDGLPLFLEVLASQLEFFTPHFLLENLEIIFSAYNNFPSTIKLSEETQTTGLARSTKKGSYYLLSTEEQNLLSHLALLKGEFDLRLAYRLEASFTRPTPSQLLAKIKLLADKNVLQMMAEPPDPIFSVEANPTSAAKSESGIEGELDIRFKFIGISRHLAYERLAESGERDRVKNQLAGYFSDLASEAESHLASGPLQHYWHTKLKNNQANLALAFEWLLNKKDRRDLLYRLGLALKISANLWGFWWRCNLVKEGRYWLEQTIDLANDPVLVQLPPDLTALYAKALNGAGWLAYCQGNHQTAQTYLERSLELYRQLDDPHSLAGVVHNLGHICSELGKYQQALDYNQQCLTLRRSLDNKKCVASPLFSLGKIYTVQGDYQTARKHLQEALAILDYCARIDYNDDQLFKGFILAQLGQINLEEGQIRPAFELIQQALEIARQYQHQELMANCYNLLGRTHFEATIFSLAYSYYEQSLKLARESNDWRAISRALLNLADYELHFEQPQLAWQILNEAEQILNENQDRRGLALCKLGRANCHLQQKSLAQAKESFIKAWLKFHELGDRPNSLKCRQHLASITTAQLETSQSLRQLPDYLEDAAQLAPLASSKLAGLKLMHSLDLVDTNQDQPPLI